jgi:phosphotransferase system  glucose/maltose/N-acetylglucosamine-specific IIC component
MKNLGIFCDHLVYFTAIGNILWPFGIFCDNLVYFFPFLVFWTKKNLATLNCRSKRETAIQKQAQKSDALAAWRSGHRSHRQKTRVRIPPWYKVFRI